MLAVTCEAFWYSRWRVPCSIFKWMVILSYQLNLCITPMVRNPHFNQTNRLDFLEPLSRKRLHIACGGRWLRGGLALGGAAAVRPAGGRGRHSTAAAMRVTQVRYQFCGCHIYGQTMWRSINKPVDIIIEATYGDRSLAQSRLEPYES
jgi:hypothetical protein